MESGYGKKRTHRQQIRYERRLLWVFTFIGGAIAAAAAVLALMK